MEKLKSSSALLLCTLFLYSLGAQTQKTGKNFFDLESDPTAFILKGYSLHLGYTLGLSRFNLGAVGLEYPENYNKNEGFKARTNGISLKWDYVNPTLKGFYFGAQSDLSELQLSDLNGENEAENLNQLSLGLRAGYRLFLFSRKQVPQKGFYLNLWAAYIFNPTAKDQRIGDAVYKIPEQVFFPTAHFGWRF